MSKFQEIQSENLQRRQRIIEGKYNCLPFPFERFRRVYPGVEQSKYLIITANQKVSFMPLSGVIH